MPDPTDAVETEATPASSHEAEAIAASKTEEFTGMTIEQIQRELRKRRANDESQRTHVDLFKATSIPQNTDGTWSPGGADAISDVDVMATDQAPRLTLPEDISQVESQPEPAASRISHAYEPVKLFQGQAADPTREYAPPPMPQTPPPQMPPQQGWQPNVAPPNQAPKGHPQSWQPNQYQSPQPYMNLNPGPSQAPPSQNTWASGASTPPPVASPMGWSAAPGPDGQPNPTLAEARTKLYGTSDDPFATLSADRRGSDSSVESYQRFRSVLPWILGVVGALAAVFVVWAVIPFPVPAPTSYTTYISPDQQYLVSKPDGWSVSRNGSKSSEVPDCETSMRYGAGRIDIELIDPSSQMLNVLLTGNGDATSVLTDPVGTIHRTTYWRGGFFVPTHYKEQPPTHIISAFGPMDCSEFTGNGGLFGWGGAAHGYRATVHGKGYVISILTICPAGSWSTMQAPFMKVLQSIGPADGSSWHPETDDTDNSGASSSTNSTTPGDSTGSPDDNPGSNTTIFVPQNGVTTVTTPDPNAGMDRRGRRSYGGDSGDQ